MEHNRYDFLCHQCQTTINLDDSDYFEASNENDQVMMFLCAHCSEGLDYCVECDRTIDTLCRGQFLDAYEIDEGDYLCSICEPNNENFLYQEDEEDSVQEPMQEEFDQNPENETSMSINQRCHECNAFVGEEDLCLVDHNNKKSMHFCHPCSQGMNHCERCDAIIDIKRRGGEYLDGFLYEDSYGYHVTRCVHCIPQNERIIG